MTKINSSIQVIDEIAFQNSLFALNAAVEAARDPRSERRVAPEMEQKTPRRLITGAFAADDEVTSQSQNLYAIALKMQELLETRRELTPLSVHPSRAL